MSCFLEETTIIGDDYHLIMIKQDEDDTWHETNKQRKCIRVLGPLD